MKNSNNTVIIEKDIHCPYCNENSAVLISETIREKSIIGCAPIGLKNGCLLVLTGGCWTIVSGLPVTDVKNEYINNIYGFCPCCGNTYPVIRPHNKNVIDRFDDTKQEFTRFANQAKGIVNNINGRINNDNNNNNNYNNNNINYNNNYNNNNDNNYDNNQLF